MTGLVSISRDVTRARDSQREAERSQAREWAQLYEAEQHARRFADTLHAANESLTRTLDLNSVLETLLDHLGQLVPYDSANVMLLTADAHLAVHTTRGYERWTDPAKIRLFRLVAGKFLEVPFLAVP